jgi:hypothetical protein
MKTKIKLTIILCFCWFAGFSQIIDANTAYQKALEFFEFKTNYEKSVSTHSYRVNHISENDTTFIYVVDIDNVGWALVSAVDNAGPYFAYSLHSFVDLNDMPPAAEMWFDYYKNIARHCMHNTQDMRFFQEEFMSKINEKSVSQGSFFLIQTTWHQRDPFNMYVETSDDCSGSYNNRCAAGCVAIAMAQIMRYWVHPLKIYDWCNMPEHLNFHEGTPNQRHAVAELTSDIAENVNTKFCNNNCSSSAWSTSAESSFKNDFNYNEHLDLKFNMYYTNSSWKEMLRQELNNHIPIYYAGCESTFKDCHAFICDGYDFDNDSQFHFNFGWGAGSNTFFTIFDDDLGEIIDFTSWQHAIFNLTPSIDETCNTQLIVHEYFRHDSDSMETYWNPIDGTIKTAFPPNNVIIRPEENVSYRAYNEIILNDGFTTDHGSNFIASIVPCPLGCKFDPIYIRMEDKQTLALIMSDEVDLLNNAPEINTKAAIDLNTDIIIYPNPFSAKLTIQHKNKNILLIELINMEGKIVYRKTHFEETINLGFLETGLYLLKLHTCSDVIITKIIKQ